MGRIYMIMGKSATGKDHIYRELLQDPGLDLKQIVLYTTRPKREGETDGKEYFFTDVAHLEKLRAEGRIIEERVYATVFGDWYYFTADEGQIDVSRENYLTIGTLQSYLKMRQYFGADALCPIYVQTADEIRLLRAIRREKKQQKPEFREVCRRFLADEEDFSERNLKNAQIEKRFLNDDTLKECQEEIRQFILQNQREMSAAHGRKP